MCDTRMLFARHGLRCTRQRVLLYDALAQTERHPTAEELYSIAKCDVPGLSMATVYNTLEAFCSAGLCRKLPSCGGARYDADLREHLHIATTDGNVRDVPESLGVQLLNSLPRSVLGEVERRTGVKIRRISIELHGDPVTSENGKSLPSAS